MFKNFVQVLMIGDTCTKGARGAVIVPQSSMTGKTKEEQSIKENILKHHTLEGVISLSINDLGCLTCPINLHDFTWLAIDMHSCFS